MKHRKTWRCIFAVLPIAALICALLPAPVLAATTVGGNKVNISSGRVIHDDLYLGGQNVNINGTVTGNLIAAGSTININGRVDGSVLVLGGTITVDGVVRGSVIVAGGTLDLAGRVGRDISMLGGALTLLPGSVVGRDVLSATGKTVVQGRIARDLKTNGGKVDLRSGAVIGHDLTYRGNIKPTVPPGVTLGGQVRHETGDALFTGPDAMPWFHVPEFVVWLRMVVGLLGLGLLFIWLAPKFARRAVANLESRWLASLGWGFVVLFLVPILATLIFGVGLLIGGWWLGLIVLVSYIISIMLAITVGGLTAVAWGIARAGQPMPLWAAMILGVVLISLVGAVPYVGWLACAIVMIWALGGLTMTLFQRREEPRVSSPTVMTMPVDAVEAQPPVPTPVG